MPKSPAAKAASKPESEEGTKPGEFYVRLPPKLAKQVRDTAHERAAKVGRKVSYNEVIVQSVDRGLNGAPAPAKSA